MSQPIDDGGPAFPRPGSEYNYCQEGMTLRDYLAAQALAGLLADGKNSGRFADIASDAYDFADEMIAARKGGAE